MAQRIYLRTSCLILEEEVTVVVAANYFGSESDARRV